MYSKTALLMLSGLASSASAFQPAAMSRAGAIAASRQFTSATAALGPETAKTTVEGLYKEGGAHAEQKFDADFDDMVKAAFPGAMSNQELETKVVGILSAKGYSADNTLLCTSLCCDELARCLEDDFVKVYGNNFNLGGLAGFPFAGNTGFGAMSAHIPDDGYCLMIYGPHVGIAQDGTIGKVERSGIQLLDNCCGSAIAASNYLQGITDGGATLTTKIQSFTDFQQGAVQELILPHGKRLGDADNRMHELPYALFDIQDLLVKDIVGTGAAGIKAGLASLGGIQINTAPDKLDYFHPLRFDYMNNKGEVVEDLLSAIQE